MPNIQPGQRLNPNGRPKGTVNRKTRMYNVIDILEKRGFDPVDAMITIAIEAEDIAIRRLATKDLLDKVVPSLKAIQHEGEIKSGYVLNITYANPQ